MKHNFVLILVAGVLLWLMAHGRLADLIDAMEGKAGASLDTGGTSSSPGSTSGVASGATVPGFANYHLFLDAKPSSLLSGWDIAGQLDQRGLPGAVFDWDYGVPLNTSVHLPGPKSATYEELPSWLPGRTEIFQDTTTGAKFEYLHLNADYVQGQAMQQFHGGDIVGQSGEPRPDLYPGLEVGNGPHLAVVGNSAAQQQFLKWSGA